MKRKIVVCLVIFGIVFSGVSVDFVNVKAEEKVLTITNKGSSYDYPRTAVVGQPYTFTVRWTQNFDAKCETSILFLDLNEDSHHNPWEMFETFKPGFSAGSNSHTFTVTVPDDGRSSWNVRLIVTSTWTCEEGDDIGRADKFDYTIIVTQPTPEEREVKFQGTVIKGPYNINECRGCIFWDVKVDKILYDPDHIITIGKIFSVCVYGPDCTYYVDPNSIKVGNRVEVYGPFDTWLNAIGLCDYGYIKKIDSGCEDGFLWIHCNEYEYDLYVDGSYRLTEGHGSGQGTSSKPDGICGVKLSAGDHTIILKKDGCDSVTKTVHIGCGEEKTIYVNMECDPCKNMNCDQYDGYVGEKYCKNGDVYQKYRDYYCENGECKYREEERKIEDCKEGCENGGCIVDPCKNKNCDQYDGYVGEKYCKNGDVYRKYRDYYCENGECKYWEEERKIEDCDYGCEGGGCIVKDPCKGVSCPDQCRGYDLWAYECDDGNCVPTYVIEKNCPECGYDPCEHDSDNDGVPDCEDECEDTPSSRFVDNKGCPVCLDKNAHCAGGMGAVLPIVGILPSIIVVADDLCRLENIINSGNVANILICIKSVVVDAGILIGDILLLIPDAAVIGIPLEALYSAAKATWATSECVLDLGDSYGADESFYLGIHESLSEKFAEENINAMNVYVGSPADLVIKDENGNILSKDNDMGISGGYFFEHNHYKFAFVVNPKGKYEIQTIGTGKGTYDLKIASVKHGSIKEKNYEDVEISRGEVDTYEVEVTSQGEIEVEEERDTPLWIFIVVIILLASIVGVYVSRGKLEGIKISRNFDQKMIKKLKKQLEKGEITMEEYNQKIKDLGLSQKVKTGKKAPKHFDKNLAERLDGLLESGEITREEYLQKKEDIGLTPEFDLLKRLDERFKNGEISIEEYLQKKRDLEA